MSLAGSARSRVDQRQDSWPDCGRQRRPRRDNFCEVSIGDAGHCTGKRTASLQNRRVLFGQPCIRGMRVAVASIVGMIASGITPEEMLADYSYLEAEDIRQALEYAKSSVPQGNGSGPAPLRKPRPNHQRTLRILRAMTPQQKLAQVFKLNERMLKLFRIGLRRRFPDLDQAAFEKLYLRMRIRSHQWHDLEVRATWLRIVSEPKLIAPPDDLAS